MHTVTFVFKKPNKIKKSKLSIAFKVVFTYCIVERGHHAAKPLTWLKQICIILPVVVNL